MHKTLTLTGQLAKKFGKTHRYNVADLREMLRAMCATVPGFKQYLSRAQLDGIRFAMYSGSSNIGLDEFDLAQGASEYRMSPVIEGRKRGGVMQIVIGAAILVAAYFTAGAALTAFGFGAAAATGTTMALTGMGLSMALGGVVSLLTPQPKFSIGSSSTENKPNYAFGAPVNTVAMGYPVPVLYGFREIGGAIISAGIFSSDQQ